MTDKTRTVTLPLRGPAAELYGEIEAEFERRSPWAKADGPSVLAFALHLAAQQLREEALVVEEPPR